MVLTGKQKKIISKPLRLTIEIKDPGLIAILLSRSRGLQWKEACEIAIECSQRGQTYNRHIAVSALGTQLVEAAKRDQSLCMRAVQSGFGTK